MSRLRGTLALLSLAGATPLSLALLAAALAPGWWAGELLGHLRLHMAAALLLCAPALIWRTRWGLLALAPAALGLAGLAPLLAPRPPAPPDGPTLRILHYNLDMTAADHQRAYAYLREQRPDVLLLQEVTPGLLEELRAALPGYRVAFARPLENTHGSALLLPADSAIAVRSVGEVHLPPTSPRPLIAATLEADGRPLHLLSLHVIRPRDAETIAIQAAEYAAAAAWAADTQRDGAPLIVIGDYNSTPWSPRVAGLLRDGRLRDSGAGFGYQPTWPAPLAAVGIPIDHALVGGPLAVLGRAAGPDLGGDHTPLLLTVAVGAAR